MMPAAAKTMPESCTTILASTEMSASSVAAADAVLLSARDDDADNGASVALAPSVLLHLQYVALMQHVACRMDENTSLAN